MSQAKVYIDEMLFCPLLESGCPKGEERAMSCGKAYIDTFHLFLCFRDFALRTCAVAREVVSTGNRGVGRKESASENDD
jgi:hypothetical protein